MRVLHLSDRWSERGGADWHLRCVLEALHEQGVDLHLAVGREDAAPHPAWPLERVPGLAHAGAWGGAVEALDALVDRVRPDRIHVHNALSPDVLAWAERRGALMTVQDHRSFCPGAGKWTLEGRACDVPLSPEACAGCFQDAAYGRQRLELTRARLAAVRRMRALVVLSEYMRDELITAGVDGAHVHVIPPFVQGLAGARAPGPACVLVAGRLVDAKGVDDAVEVWRRSGVSLPLVFAGTGSARARLESVGFEVLGWLPHTRLAGVYRRARALLFLPRWQEPFGIAGLEAASLGVPVVAWHSGGIAEWWPAARRIPRGDLAAAALALGAAVQEPSPAARPQTTTRAEATRRLLALYSRGQAASRQAGPRDAGRSAVS